MIDLTQHYLDDEAIRMRDRLNKFQERNYWRKVMIDRDERGIDHPMPKINNKLILQWVNQNRIRRKFSLTWLLP